MSDALTTAQARLDAYIAAEARILARGQDIGVEQSRRRDAELRDIQAQISRLQTEIAALTAATSGQSRFVRVVPR